MKVHSTLIKDLEEVRDLPYKMQRPAIVPSVRAHFVLSSLSDPLTRRYV
jgi:hypothetical protein